MRVSLGIVPGTCETSPGSRLISFTMCASLDACSPRDRDRIPGGSVCSRRVHDGYATIRSRGRPRAVYRSDSEELLKEAGGPYALPRLSNFRVAGDDARQVPRWADLGRNQPPMENYGTLRAGKSREEPRRVILETFSRNESPREDKARNGARQETDVQRAHRLTDRKDRRADVGPCDGWKPEVCAPSDSWRESGDRQVYETVPARNDPAKPFCVVGRTCRENGANINDGQRPDDSKEDVEREKMPGKRSLKSPRGGRHVPGGDSNKSTRRNVKSDVTRGSKSSSRSESAKEPGLPIYAVPNAFTKSRRERRMIVSDGNYVPSGDLYRTTAKYIEDINRNLAQIDKSYEQLKASPGTYGVINKSAKDDFARPAEAHRSADLFGYARKRDMAPMPPIVVGNDVDDTDERSDNGHLRRPNSRGKLPPKVLPRSSSIENTSRHSTGSTTASSSRSTESLYAISESFTELAPREEATCSPLKPSRRGNLRRLSPELKGDGDCERTSGIVDVRRDDRGESAEEPKGETDDDPRGLGALERASVPSAIRRNRSRVERETADEKRVRQTLEDRLKDRRCGTLPSRKLRASSRPLHKSSEDILDGAETSRARPHLQQRQQQRSYSSSVDVNCERRVDEDQARRGPVYTVDAADVILKGQMERSGYTQDYFPSFERREDKVQHGGFATLPRRGNLSKDQPDPIRRFSGNGPILEPLYEHAVSDPVRPRGIQNVIPWWELATRKYRHRSCPSLQVNWVRRGGSRRLGTAETGVSRLRSRLASSRI